MSFIHEKASRRYLIFLMCFAAAILFSFLLLSWLHGKEMQSLLYVKEQMIASSLLEQGMSPARIAEALKNSTSSESGAELLRQIGHTEIASYVLFPIINRSVSLFAVIGFGIFAVLAAVLMGAAICFLKEQENMYRKAEKIITQFSDGNFENHLPRNENGALFQLFSAAEELAVALQAKSENEQRTKEFLRNTISDISHQLKTPLSALHMYTEIISEEPDNGKIVRDFSEKSMRSLGRIDQLIQVLLKVTRLDAGSIVFHKREQLVTDLVACAMEQLTARAYEEKKQIIVTGDSAATVFCDMEWTSEAIENVIKNALDHTDHGGTIHIDWEKSPSIFRLSVSDNGHGIAQEDIHHVFKRFYRSRNSNDRQGVGLGLSLAKAIVEGQDGMLSVSSTPGKGSTFTISFLTDT